MALTQRRCPKCSTKVGWARLWLKPWIWARWPCQGCGAMLRFSLSRRLIVTLGGILAMISGYAAGEYVRQQGFPLAVALIATVATVVVLGVLVLLLDGVKLA